MILQSLYDYYRRKAADPESGIEPEGFEWKAIPFIVVIGDHGEFIAIEETSEAKDGKMQAKRYLLPRARERQGGKSYETTNLLWDHIGYVFGEPKSDSPKDIVLAKNQYRVWRQAVRAMESTLGNDPGVAAVIAFYQNGQVDRVRASSAWPACVKKSGTNVTFRLQGRIEPVPCSESVREFVRRTTLQLGTAEDNESCETGAIIATCLVTGNSSRIARLHHKTPINKDCKSLVGLQKDSGYDSYGKEQAYNCPVSIQAEAAYTTAIEHLLRTETNRIRLGDSIALFWSDRKSPFEEAFQSFWETDNEDPDRGILAVETILRSPFTGNDVPEGEVRFFMLGLGPGGGSRIAVRFWYPGTVAQVSERMRQHFSDLRVVEPANCYDAAQDRSETGGGYALLPLLRQLAFGAKDANVPSNLVGDMVVAILCGGRYPALLLQHTIRRIRATRQVKRGHAALLKAYLLRKHTIDKSSTEEKLQVALDPTNSNPAYRLGRLFAALEKIQEEAQPGINATIRDRFYGAATASPVTVFPQLLKLKNHHLAKLQGPALRIIHERRLTEIMSGMPVDMPAHLAMEDQARFAIGYYHQRQALFTKATRTEK
jgi:CRISPR-associated protein Csd1